MRNAYSDEIRQILEFITSSSPTTGGFLSNVKLDLNFFEGGWEGILDRSFCYARIVDNQLFIPYCYGGSDALTAHYYNCTLIKNTLFARYRWIDGSTSGYAMYEIKSQNRLEGGWWHIDNLSIAALNTDVLKNNDSVSGMVKNVFRRKPDMREAPYWVEEYFDNLQHYKQKM